MRFASTGSRQQSAQIESILATNVVTLKMDPKDEPADDMMNVEDRTESEFFLDSK